MMMKEFFVMKLNRLNIGFCFLNFVNCFFFVKKKIEFVLLSFFIIEIEKRLRVI